MPHSSSTPHPPTVPPSCAAWARLTPPAQKDAPPGRETLGETGRRHHVSHVLRGGRKARLHAQGAYACVRGIQASREPPHAARDATREMVADTQRLPWGLTFISVRDAARAENEPGEQAHRVRAPCEVLSRRQVQVRPSRRCARVAATQTAAAAASAAIIAKVRAVACALRGGRDLAFVLRSRRIARANPHHVCSVASASLARSVSASSRRRGRRILCEALGCATRIEDNTHVREDLIDAAHRHSNSLPPLDSFHPFRIPHAPSAVPKMPAPVA